MANNTITKNTIIIPYTAEATDSAENISSRSSMGTYEMEEAKQAIDGEEEESSLFLNLPLVNDGERDESSLVA